MAFLLPPGIKGLMKFWKWYILSFSCNNEVQVSQSYYLFTLFKSCFRPTPKWNVMLTSFILMAWWSIILVILRRSLLLMFYKIVTVENLAKVTGKHMCRSPFFDKVVGLKLARSLKKDSNKDVFILILQNF